MVKIFFYILAVLTFSACAKAQPSETPHAPSGYLYKVEPGIPGKEVYICGQRPFDTNGELVSPGDLAGQTNQVFENIKASLKTVNMTLRNVTQVTYMIKGASTQVDSASASALSKQATSHFTQMPGIVQMKSVSQTVREDVLIEIEVIAVK